MTAKNIKLSQEPEFQEQVKQRRARIILGEMADAGILKKEGAYRTTVYVLKK